MMYPRVVDAETRKGRVRAEAKQRGNTGLRDHNSRLRARGFVPYDVDDRTVALLYTAIVPNPLSLLLSDKHLENPQDGL